MAVIWRGGCIIRAAFLDRIRAAYAANPQLPTLLADPDFAQGGHRGAGRLARGGRDRGEQRRSRCPGSRPRSPTTTRCAPERLPAALIQGLRDFFGAHTYRRTDREGSFHTLWAEDRSEVSR